MNLPLRSIDRRVQIMGSFIDFIRDDFFQVAPIILAGGFGLAIILERTYALMWTFPLRKMKIFFDKLRDLMMTDRLADAVALCEHYRDKPVAQVAKEALLRAHQPQTVIEDGLELAVTDAITQIQ